MSQQTALITGASGGIGLEFASIFAQNQTNLLLVARNGNKLQEIKEDLEKKYKIQVFILAQDLTHENGVKNLLAFIDNQKLTIHFLINNAGFGVYGEFVESDLEKNLNMLHLNVQVLVALTHEIGREMKKNGYGKILNVGSTAAYMPGPYMSVYFASKAFVRSFSLAVNAELKGSGVSVTCLNPGATRTGFEDAATGMNESGVFKLQKVSTAKSVAIDGYNALMNNKPEVVSGWMNKISVFFTRIFPTKWVLLATKQITAPQKN